MSRPSTVMVLNLMTISFRDQYWLPIWTGTIDEVGVHYSRARKNYGPHGRVARVRGRRESAELHRGRPGTPTVAAGHNARRGRAGAAARDPAPESHHPLRVRDGRGRALSRARAARARRVGRPRV